MTHEEARLAHSRKLAAELEQRELSELDMHLRDCPECRAYIAEMDKALGLVGTPAPKPIPDAAYARIMNRVRATPQYPAPMSLHTIILISMSLLIVGLIVLYFCLRKPHVHYAPALQVEQTAPKPQEPALSKPEPSNRDILAVERILMSRPRPIVGMAMGFRGGPEGSEQDDMAAIKAALRKAGLACVASDNDMLEILHRRLSRKDEIKKLLNEGSIVEGPDAMLSVRPDGRKLSRDEAVLLKEENFDRGGLNKAYLHSCRGKGKRQHDDSAAH